MFIYNKQMLPELVLPDRQEWVQLYDKTWELAFRNMEYIHKPGWKPQLTCMPGVDTIWQWDSCLMVFITNYSNATISALNNLDNLYRLRRPSDGYMSMAYRISTEQPAWPGRINPPLMAWAEWEAYRIRPDKSRLEQVLPALEGNYRFIENNRRRVSGLYWFEDPGSTGMDNSPRGPYFCEKLDGSGICHVDLACQQALSAKCIGNICQALGDGKKAAFYYEEQERINGLINRYHWNEKSGFYYDFFGRGTADQKVKFIPCKTAAAFWTVLCGAAQGGRLERMLQILFDPEEFYTEVPFATLSKSDLNYDPSGGYWLGGVWAPTNFALIRGLEEAGYEKLAKEAAEKYLQAISDVFYDPAYGSVWECYCPEAAKPATAEAGELVRPDFVGWSGLAPITMLIENIIGLRFDASQNTISFDLRYQKPCGLNNMAFNGSKVSIQLTHYDPRPGHSALSICCEKPLTLKLKNGAYQGDFSVCAGKSELSV